MVVDVDSPLKHEIAVAGELFTAEARRRQLAGMVIDGACRDTPTIKRLNFPIYSLAVSPMAGRCQDLDRTRIQVPLCVGGVEVKPGDVIFGDDDGVVNLGSNLDEIKVLAERAAEIRRHETLVLKEVLERNRCLLEFMNLMEVHEPHSDDA